MGGSVPDLNEVGILADESLARPYREEVARLLKRDNIHFPGAQPVSFARKHLAELEREDYYVCEKSDGIRCLLYFTVGDKDENGNPQEIHYLIDRKNDYYWVRPGLHFPRAPADPKDKIEWGSFYVDTLLDGELLYDTMPSGERILKYLVFDCLLLEGNMLIHRTLDKRLAHFKERLYGPYQKLREAFPDDTAGFPFVVEEKSFQLSYAAEWMFKDILPNLKHGHDGLVFTCRTTPYHFGTDQHILKWKPARENTIDFKVGLTFPELPRGEDDDGSAIELDYDALPDFMLYVHYSDGDDRPYAPLFVTTDDWERMKSWSVENNDGVESQVIECYRDEAGRWRFSRFRNDKLEANHISTVDKVLESIEDSVDGSELIAAAGSIRKSWKERSAKRGAEDKARQMADFKRREEMKRRAEEAKS